MSEAIIYSGTNSGAGIFGYAPNPATNLTAVGKNRKVELKWTDPDDRVIEGTTVGWSYTKIVRKTGSYPIDPNDGTVIVQNSVKNQYQTTPYEDTSIVANTTYYYTAFACSDYGVFAESAPQAAATPFSYRIMTVKINENDSNPTTCCSYADDAVGMPSGRSDEAIRAWQDFIKYRPCAFKNGQVVGYLNPNDFGKFENGDPNDTSDESQSVMIEFPRRGISISRSGSILTISMTDEPNNSNFTYYAHQRGDKQCDYFYLSSYLLSCEADDTYEAYRHDWYRSTMNNQCDRTMWASRVHTAHNDYDGYEIFTWFQRIYFLVISILQFKRLDISSAMGDPFTSGNSDGGYTQCGYADNKGMFSDWSTEYPHIKMFGIERANQGGLILGGVWRYRDVLRMKTDGLYSDNDYEMSLDINIGSTLQGGILYIKQMDAHPEGFGLLTDGKGSSSTYYCSYASIYGYSESSSYANYDVTTSAGVGSGSTTNGRNIFAIYVNSTANQVYSFTRLSFYN